MYKLKLIDGATGLGNGPTFVIPKAVRIEKQAQVAMGVVGGSGAATIDIQGRPYPAFPWITVRVLSVSAGVPQSDNIAVMYPEMRGVVSGFSPGMTLDCYLLVFDRD